MPQFPDSCYVFFHAVLHFALLITHGGWPLGECVVGGDGITRGSGALRTGGSALGLAANSFPISSFYWRSPLLHSSSLLSLWTVGRETFQLVLTFLYSLNSSSLNGSGFLSCLLHFSPPHHLGDNSLLSCPHVLSGRIQVSAGNTPLLILDSLLASPLPSSLVRG